MAALVTAAEYKASRGFTGSDYDTRMASAAGVASAKIRAYCNRDPDDGFESAARTEVYDGTGTQTLHLREWPVDSIASVKFRTSVSSGAAVYGETVDDSGYYVGRDGELVRAGSVGWENEPCGQWPVGVANIQAVYTAGYATIPDDIAEAAFMLMDTWFDDAGRNVVTASVDNRGVDQKQRATTMEITARIGEMLARYRRPYA